MDKYGKWEEQSDTRFRTSGDNKIVTLTPAASLTGASSTLTFPDYTGITDTIVSRTSTDTMTNKTLTAPVISSIVNTGTLTLPTSTDTLVGRATTDTLTNKTIDGDDNTIQDLALSVLKTTGNTSVFIQRDGSGDVIDSTKAVPAGDVIGTSDSQTLTNKTINADNNTISNIDNGEIKAAAGILVNKLEALTASRAVELDGSGFFTASAVTSVELNYLDGVTSAIQTQLDAKQGDVVTTEGDTIVGDNGGNAVRLPIGGSGTVLTSNGTTAAWTSPAGTGDVTAAAVMTDNTLVRGDGGAKGIQDSGIVIDDSDNMSAIGTIGSGAITSTGAVEGTSITDGTATLSSGSLASAVNVTGSGTVQGGTLTDGTASITSGAVSGVTTLTTSSTTTLSALSSTGIVHNNASGVLSTSLIVNADVDASAAIAGSKVTPTFGAQNVSASGTTAFSGTDNGFTGTNAADYLVKIDNAGAGWGLSVDTESVASNRSILDLYASGTLEHVFRANGAVGLGSTAPAGRLHLTSTAASSVPLLIRDSADTDLLFQVSNSGATGDCVVDMYRNSESGTHENTIAFLSDGDSFFNGGNLIVGGTSTIGGGAIMNLQPGGGIACRTDVSTTSGTHTIYQFFDGDATLNGSIIIDTSANTTNYSTTSDARLKHEHKNYDALSLISKLNPTQYERIQNPGIKEYGLVAQEVKEVVPQAVISGGENENTDPWLMDYSQLVGVLVKAVKELKEEVDFLKM